MDFDKAILDVFVAESKEHLGYVEESLLNLESGSAQFTPDIINKIFRSIHTIKGSGGLLGLQNIGDLAHVMETLLSMLRSGEIEPNPQLIDGLLEGVDKIGEMLDDIDQSETVECSALKAKIERHIRGEYDEEDTEEPAGTATEKMESQLDWIKLVDQDSKDLDFEVDSFALKSIPFRKTIAIVSRVFRHDNKESSEEPQQFQKSLTDHVELVYCRVKACEKQSQGNAEFTNMCYRYLVAWEGSVGDIIKKLDVAPETVIKIKRVNIPSETAGSGDVSGSDRGGQSQPEKKSDPQALKSVQQIDIDQHLDEALAINKEKATDTIRMKIDILDKLMQLAGELVLVRNQQLQNLDQADAKSRNIAKRLDLVTTELQENIMRTRMQPVGNLFQKFTRIVRDLGKKLGKKIVLNTSGNDVELDRTILESLSDPMTHLIRNSCDHGIETPAERKKTGKSPIGHIELLAYHEGGQINIRIQDDGAGLNADRLKEKAKKRGLKTDDELSRMTDQEAYGLIFLPGFSTADQISDVSGRGVGMDVVRTSIEKQGGTIELNSGLGEGTEISMRLPLTLAIIPCLIVSMGKSRFALPQVNIEEIVSLYDHDVVEKIESAGHREVYRLRDTLLPLVRLEEILGRKEKFNEDFKAEITAKYRKEALEIEEEAKRGGKLDLCLSFVVLKIGRNRFGLIVDKVIGTEEIVVTPMHVTVKDLQIYAGAAVMGDGEVALIVDVFGVSRHAGLVMDHQDKNYHDEVVRDVAADVTSLILFKYGAGERFGLELTRVRRIERIKMLELENVGGKEFVILDGVSTLVLRMDKVLDVTPGIITDEMYFLLSKDDQHPHGILVSELLDIGDYTYQLNSNTHKEEGLLGTAIIEEAMTLMIDMAGLVKRVEPRWFETKVSEEDEGKDPLEGWTGPTPDPDIPGLIWA